MLLLLDIGNTHTHLGLANRRRVTRQTNIPTSAWSNSTAQEKLRRFVGKHTLKGAALCSVVPHVTKRVSKTTKHLWNLSPLVLTPKTLRGVGINYPKPNTIGADRLANAAAARHHYGQPVVVVDFGTAVTFDVVDRQGDYVGGIIAPGLAAMTNYLHEKTALLPLVQLREVSRPIGKSTEEAMRIGAVHGYRGLIHGLLAELKQTLNCRKLAVVATGGYAQLITARLPEINAVEPLLTLEGLRLVWQAHSL